MLISYDDQARIAEILFACGQPELYTRFVTRMDREGFEALSNWRALRREHGRKQVESVGGEECAITSDMRGRGGASRS